MKTCKQLYTKMILVSISLWFFTMWPSYQGLADEPPAKTVRMISDEEIPAILDFIANRIHDNYEKINAWSGEIDVKLNMLHTGTVAKEVFVFTDKKGEIPEAILQKVQEKITFAFDANKKTVYVDNIREKPSKYFKNADGTDLGNSGANPYWSTTIAGPDIAMHAKPKSFNKDNTISHRKAFKEPSKKNRITGLYEGIDDPRSVFMPGGKPWVHFDKLIKYIDQSGKVKFDGYTLKIEEIKHGENTQYIITEPLIVNMKRSDPSHYIIITKIFSSQYGFNIMLREVTSGGGLPLQKYTWEYELKEGVYLPKKHTEINYGSDGEIASEKECVYINNKINHEISPETFDYKNLNLKNGDIFIDKILSKEYRYNADTKSLDPIEK